MRHTHLRNVDICVCVRKFQFQRISLTNRDLQKVHVMYDCFQLDFCELRDILRQISVQSMKRYGLRSV